MHARLLRPLALICALAVAACTGHARLDRRELRADPSSIVTTELALSRTVREEGQWTAFADFATDEAVMFVPQPVVAKDWLDQQPNPAGATVRELRRVWASCDGSLAVSRGALQRPDGTPGYFVTVWQRQPDGSYQWVMNQAEPLPQLTAEPEMIQAEVADCSRPSAAPPPEITATGQEFGGTARDGTLQWQVLAQADGTRAVHVLYWNGSAWSYAVRERIASE